MTRFNVGIGSVGWTMILFAPGMALLAFLLTAVNGLPLLGALAIGLGAAAILAAIAALGFGLQRPFEIGSAQIVAGGRVTPFAQIARVQVFSNRGTMSMWLTDAVGRRVAVFALNASVRPGLNSLQWGALRAAIAGSSATFVQRGVPSSRAPRPEDTVPLSTALAVIDAEIAALGPYGRTGHGGPFYREIVRRYSTTRPQ